MPRRDPPSGTSVEVVRGEAAFDRLGDAWDDLAERVDAVPFLRRGWIRRWWSAFGVGVPEVHVARAGAKTTGVLPTVVRAGRGRAMANVHSPLFAALAVDGRTAAALWHRALTAPRRRGFEAMAVREEPHGFGALDAGAATAGRRTWIRNEFAVPTIDLGATDWDTYASARGKSLRKTVRRHRRRLSDAAPLRLDHVTAGPLDAVVAEILRIEASGWKGARGTAMASQEATRHFYTDVIRWLADHGWLRLAVLRHGDRAIAFELIVDHGGVWYPLKAGFDDAYAEHSPGVILQWDVLEAAFACGVDRYDYCGEARAYTERWADGHVVTRRVAVFHPVLGLGDRLALQVARPAAKRLRAAVRR